jgi:hypothetical protein
MLFGSLRRTSANFSRAVSRSLRSNAAMAAARIDSFFCSISLRFCFASSIRSEACSFVTSMRKIRDQRSIDF